VLVVVYARTGDVLLLHRVDQRDDFWQSVTGSLRWDESADEAARRELGEETGIADVNTLVDCRRSFRFPILPQWRPRYAPDVLENLEHAYTLCLPEPVPVVLNPREHDEFAWLPREQAAQTVWSWTNRSVINGLVF